MQKTTSNPEVVTTVPEKSRQEQQTPLLNQYKKRPAITAQTLSLTVKPQAVVHTMQVGKTDLTPLFLMHGDWTGLPFYCYALARSLGRARAFYALDAFRFNGPVFPLSIEEMAAEHLKAIQAIQPQGPYIIAGFCNGSLLAYEIAHQLHTQGQKVQMLLLIAPFKDAPRRIRIYNAIRALGRFFHIKPLHLLTSFVRIRHAIRHIYLRLHLADEKMLHDFAKLLAVDPRLDQMFPVTEALHNDYVRIYPWLSTMYQQLTFQPENVKFIWSQEELDVRTRWGIFEQDTNSPIIPGEHLEGVTEHLDLFIEAFTTILQADQQTATDKAASTLPNVDKLKQ